jgi:hypothetical protein
VSRGLTVAAYKIVSTELDTVRFLPVPQLYFSLNGKLGCEELSSP